MKVTWDFEISIIWKNVPNPQPAMVLKGFHGVFMGFRYVNLTYNLVNRWVL